MNQKIILLKDYKNSQTKQKLKNISKMFFLIIIVGVVIGTFSWHYFVENVETIDVKIPPSNNVTFNEVEPLPITVMQIANEFENAEGKPILFYIYTTWCKICVKNFPIINEISREFQNTELKVVTLAIDRDLDPQALKAYINKFGEVYFPLQYLAFKDGFLEFFKRKKINYNNRIPFTVLISREGEVITKFSGTKKRDYLRNKIIKELYSNS